jgi:hypothetical protein
MVRCIVWLDIRCFAGAPNVTISAVSQQLRLRLKFEKPQREAFISPMIHQSHDCVPERSLIETRSLPTSLAATHRGFAFYVAFPKSSIVCLSVNLHTSGK